LIQVWIARLGLNESWLSTGAGKMFKASAFFILPESEIPKMKARADASRERAATLLEEARQLGEQVKEMESFYRKHRKL
jgi:hypothetical protein